MAYNKYGNKKVTFNIDGESITFDSKAEGARANELVMLRNSGQINHLEFQPEYVLQASFRHNGKTHRAIKYIADFRYEADGVSIVEDVKGHLTDTYKMKKKLFLSRFGQDIKFYEVYFNRGRSVIKEF